ncbi:hypothetical protein RSOL_392700 [Rhizoctonia solani AG-3 Rhs1AP]|uniref:Transmembrane protein n=2 Tax=Rhizoctonia solani AG-3 TaxID=1086053 RepID=A0A074S6L1_9AGAM|nr:hypothetical protein RSOL_392700 [Rhizoctonia solani AG-3 Rhs1AP]KEP52508.1 hypothetical protein V565_044490 [Rhizoctonia solani 123E]
MIACACHLVLLTIKGSSVMDPCICRSIFVLDYSGITILSVRRTASGQPPLNVGSDVFSKVKPTWRLHTPIVPSRRNWSRRQQCNLSQNSRHQSLTNQWRRPSVPSTQTLELIAPSRPCSLGLLPLRHPNISRRAARYTLHIHPSALRTQLRTCSTHLRERRLLTNST